MRSRDESRAARPTPDTPVSLGPEHEHNLEEELSQARRALDETLAAVQGGPDLGSRSLGMVEAVNHLRGLVAARMMELEEKRAALEAANSELRSLTKNLDSIVRQRTRALAESESQLRRKNVELDRLNRMRTEFIAIAAHELRTPMTSLVGYLDLFSERIAGEMPPDSRRQLLSLHRNAHRLKRLVEDMLDVSRLETGTITLRRAPSSLPEIVLAVVEEVGPVAQGRGAVLLDLAELPAIDADADKVHQVVSNLLGSSLKLTTSGGKVRITVDRDPGAPDRQARLRLWADGTGVPADLRGRIFDPFLDVASAKHHTSSGPDSAGLGLRIARGIVELHGGSIHFESVEGEYTEFTVLLPFAQASGSGPVTRTST
jgi:signal transduction histidine kinase